MTDAGRILVTGIGGALSDMVARALRDAGHDVRGMSADPAANAPDGVPITYVAPSDTSGLSTALQTVSRVFLDTNDVDVHRMTAALKAADLRSVVVLSSAVVELAAEFDVFGYRELETAVRSAGLTYTFLRPTDLSGNALRWAGQIKRGTVAAPYLDAYQEPVDEHDIVDAAVAALSEDRHHGRVYRLSGGQSLTRRELIRIVADAVGRPVEAIEQSPDEWRAAATAAGIPGPAADARLATWSAAVGRPGRTDATITAVTGAVPRTFTVWATAHRAEFT
ncbi:NmrA family NAD(P)-binding protein [Nonomuraea sp. NPDC049784]|uniref:NmrA family NAD(P)-binding protein n=1 Tax=Nonomuraea sp. NPDC049784 TaxID=3154361 RepID=UPI0033E79527